MSVDDTSGGAGRQSARAQRRDVMRRRLLEVVQHLISEGESFTEMSVERLVSEAGISRSTFYVYFEDKGDLLRGWFEDVAADLNRAARAWWTLGPDATYDDVRAALETVVATYRPHTPLMAAAFDAAAYDASLRHLVTTLMDTNAAGLRKHIREGQARGFVDARLHPAETAEWLTGMAERGLHRAVRTAAPEQLVRLVDGLADIVWNTLYAPARRRQSDALAA